jgi:hypothetical protein
MKIEIKRRHIEIILILAIAALGIWGMLSR